MSASNPHRSTASSTDGTTQYTFDPLNRVTLIVQPDGSQVSTNYLGNQTTVTDEAGKKRKSQTDGLGRLAFVWEDPNGLNYETDYQYDVLGNLLRVDQKGGDTNSANWRTRTFAYNSFSQLLCAANPEIAIVTCPSPDTGSYTAGTIRYAYDNEGNVITKTAPRPNQTGAATVITTNSYDALNRLTQKAYNDGSTPTVKYGYDGVALTGCTTAPPALTDANPAGRRTAMCDGSGATSWKHDEIGRTLQERRKIGTATAQNVIYTFNLDGSLATLAYPSGRKVTYATGAAGRTLSAVDQNGTPSNTTDDINYLTGATYAPQGALYTFTNGSSIAGAMTYNSRLQPVQLYFTAGTISPTTLSQLQQAACPTAAATIMSRSYNFAFGTTNSGNVNSITNCRDTNRTQNFDYDSLNRIQHAYTSGPNWGEAFTIDPWGNLTNKAPYLGKTSYEPLNVAPATTGNRLIGYGYDAAGNMTSNGGASYTYDAENRLITAGGVTYTYDGDGNRVKKSNGTLYWGAGPLAESDLSASATSWKDYVFFNGKRVARRNASDSSVHYFFSDHLGSTSVTTNSTGATLEEDLDYYPYGGTASGTASDHYLFTGKERDTESGLDNFGKRYYASSMGRFVTIDIKIVSSRRVIDPQQWNMYSYARNNPLTYLDPDGLEAVILAEYTRAYWLPIGRGFAATDLGGSFATPAMAMGNPYRSVASSGPSFNGRMNSATNYVPLDAGESGCLPGQGCWSFFSSHLFRIQVIAEIGPDLNPSGQSCEVGKKKATLSHNPLYEVPGISTPNPPLRTGNDLFGPTPGAITDKSMKSSGWSKLDLNDLQAIDEALNDAMYAEGGLSEDMYDLLRDITVAIGNKRKSLKSTAPEGRGAQADSRVE